MFALDTSKSYVEFCNKVCVFDSAASTAAEAKCTLPALSTTYSNENFAIATESEDLRPLRTFGSDGDDNAALAFDDEILTQPDNTAMSLCYVGLEFTEGFVGMIS